MIHLPFFCVWFSFYHSISMLNIPSPSFFKYRSLINKVTSDLFCLFQFSFLITQMLLLLLLLLLWLLLLLLILLLSLSLHFTSLHDLNFRVVYFLYSARQKLIVMLAILFTCLSLFYFWSHYRYGITIILITPLTSEFRVSQTRSAIHGRMSFLIYWFLFTSPYDRSWYYWHSDH